MATIQTPPFYAAKFVPAFTNTQGGPRRNSNGQVLDINRKPIPRLYSAGEWEPSTAGIIRAAATFWSASFLAALRASGLQRRNPGHNSIGIEKGVPVIAIRTGLVSVFSAAVILLMSSHALADEADSRKACESLATLSTQAFRVDTSDWVAVSRVPAGPPGATDGGAGSLFVSRRLDPRPSGIEE